MSIITGLSFKHQFRQKDFLSTEDFNSAALIEILELALAMKKNRYDARWSNILKNKVFLLMFFNPSLRTHVSFETAVTELGGYPLFRNGHMDWQDTLEKPGENIKDIANVLSRYACGIGIRLTMDKLSSYGEGHDILQEFAKWSSIPVINMADDKFHPCQGLADIMAWCEYISTRKRSSFNINNLKGKRLLLTWGRSRLTRPWSSVQSHLLLASRFGMNITLAHPQGFNLDPEVCTKAQSYCHSNGTEFKIIHDPDDGYENADIVIVRNWISPQGYHNGKFQYEDEVELALKQKNWTVTPKKMVTNNAGFANPMPIDRNYEAMDEVIDSKNSLIYEVAENRLHVQKALLAKIL